MLERVHAPPFYMDDEKGQIPTTERVTLSIQDSNRGDIVSWVRGYDSGFECGRLAAYRDCITFALAGVIVICVLASLGLWDRV